MKKVIFLLALVSCMTSLLAQKDFKTELEKGDSLYLQGEFKYRFALKPYLEANALNPEDAQLNFKIGLCYLYSNDKTQSLAYFRKAIDLDPEVDTKIRYSLGRAFHLNAQWQNAMHEYKRYKESFGVNESYENIEDVNKKIEECKAGMDLMLHPVSISIENLGEVVNSPYAEYSPIISADESVLLFTSKRDNTTGGKMDEYIGDYFEDIYISHNENGHWTTPENLGAPINTDVHDATVALSADGQKLLIYKDDKGNGNLYECDLKGEEWLKPHKMDKNINSYYHESSASFTFDGRALYFVSDRPEGYGGRDIYKSTWDDIKQQPGKPVNMGPGINTKYNEGSVYMMPDGRTMYFSSQGHKTMGGYDIFKVVYDDSTQTWSAPVNIGYPVNTPDDDVFFVMAANGERAYYASFKTDGYGEKDLYVIHFLESTGSRVTILKGIVRDATTLQPLEAKIEVTDNAKNEQVASFNANSITGKYLLALPSGKNYGIYAEMEGYLFHSENLNINDKVEYQEIVKDIYLQKIYPESTDTAKVAVVEKAVIKEEKENVEIAENVEEKESVEIKETVEEKESVEIKETVEEKENVEIKEIVEESKQEEAEAKTATATTTKEETAKETPPAEIIAVEKKDAEFPTIVLNNIFFDFDKYTLRKESTMELQKIVKLMKDYPKLKVEISGHTDSKGSDEYNQRLSENRAKTVVDYLIEKGVNKKRMTYKGYGEQKTVATNETEEGRQLNRRTEFKITEK